MNSNVGKILKVLAIIIWLLGFILGIISGSLSIGLYSQSSFNFWTALLYWVIFFVAGVFYYAFGELVENVAGLRGETGEQLRLMNSVMSRMTTLMESMDKSLIAVSTSGAPQTCASGESGTVSSQQAASAYFFCPKCGNRLPSGSGVCSNCGADLSQYSETKQPVSGAFVMEPPADGEYKKSEMQWPREDQIICPCCGTVQRSNRSVCFQCDAKFID